MKRLNVFALSLAAALLLSLSYVGSAFGAAQYMSRWCVVDTLGGAVNQQIPVGSNIVPMDGPNSTADANGAGSARNRAFIPKVRFSSGSLDGGAFRANYLRILIKPPTMAAAMGADTLSFTLFNGSHADSTASTYLFFVKASTASVPEITGGNELLKITVPYDSVGWFTRGGILKNRLVFEMGQY